MEFIYMGKSDFDLLSSSVEFEDIMKGRKGAILVDIMEKKKGGKRDFVPVVRSTTKYKNPAQKMGEVYKSILPKKGHDGEEIRFNNAMIELYTDEYKTMAYHSDLAIDLVEDSKICIYSSYPEWDKRRRVLMIKDKLDDIEMEVVLLDGMVVTFDTLTNSRYLHKIVGESTWLGITYRLSRTNARDLHMASEDEKKEFYTLRGIENKSIDFRWGSQMYTVNPGDLLPVTEEGSTVTGGCEHVTQDQSVVVKDRLDST